MGSRSFALKLETPETSHSEGTETEGNSGRQDFFPKTYFQQTTSKTLNKLFPPPYTVWMVHYTSLGLCGWRVANCFSSANVAPDGVRGPLPADPMCILVLVVKLHMADYPSGVWPLLFQYRYFLCLGAIVLIEVDASPIIATLLPKIKAMSK